MINDFETGESERQFMVLAGEAWAPMVLCGKNRFQVGEQANALGLREDFGEAAK